MARPYYESDRGASEYLLLHYGDAGVPVPPLAGPKINANFPAQCAAQISPRHLPAAARGLDLGCAVGRSTFELARRCGEVVGVDYSARFIALARQLQKAGHYEYQSFEEGGLTQVRRAVVPAQIHRERVRFLRGDAMNLPAHLGTFDVILMANLIDRLARPQKCLNQLRRLTNPGAQIIITSPYTWLAEYTPRRFWLGGFTRQGRAVKTLDTLRQILAPEFELLTRRDLPFLIREHSRKFQLGVAEATVWIRQ